ncbi:unnamed protein product [Hydatigera taeniaeformis]|uniref:Apple domain-containing protein n=1 Tax=Hydatigena taeniaeformis TaxID=6205 RepID=A0A0R3WIX1_HYDTA|nr:unnamed protein product [Hydatigera taeniaeformis]
MDNKEFWSSSYLQLESCEPRREMGEWCEWGEWGACEFATCTRTRRRVCDCPSPADWKTGACAAVLPQDDIRIGRCIIPFFFKGRYYGDCEKIGSATTPQCLANLSNRRVTAKCKPEIKSMEERDVGPCDDWRLAQGWSQTGIPSRTRTIIDARSDVGKQCYNPKLFYVQTSTLEPCPEKYYFSASGQRNVYSNLNNLAFSPENCKFACAIDPKCIAVEFSEGFFCNLLTTFANDKLTRQVGTTTFTKPRTCVKKQRNVDPINYPYALALEDLYAGVV